MPSILFHFPYCWQLMSNHLTEQWSQAHSQDGLLGCRPLPQQAELLDLRLSFSSGSVFFLLRTTLPSLCFAISLDLATSLDTSYPLMPLPHSCLLKVTSDRKVPNLIPNTCPPPPLMGNREPWQELMQVHIPNLKLSPASCPPLTLQLFHHSLCVCVSWPHLFSLFFVRWQEQESQEEVWAHVPEDQGLLQCERAVEIGYCLPSFGDCIVSPEVPTLKA